MFDSAWPGTNLFEVATTGTSCGAVAAMHDVSDTSWRTDPDEPDASGRGGLRWCRLRPLHHAGLCHYRCIRVRLDDRQNAGISGAKRSRWPRCGLSFVTVLTAGIVVLVLSGIAMITPSAVASMANPTAHGLSEVLYAFASMANNNGSAFAGLNGNVNFYNLLGSRWPC